MLTVKTKLKDYFKSTFTNVVVLICFALAFIYFFSAYIPFAEIFVSVLAIIFFAILPIQSSFCILFFLHNFLTSKINWDIGFTITLIGFVVVMLIKYIIGVKQNKYNVNLKIIISFAVSLTIGLFASISHQIYNGALLYLVYLPLIYLMFEMRRDLNIVQIVNYMLFGFILSNCLALVGQIIPNYGYYYGYQRYQAFTDNPNYLGMRAVFFAIFYFVLYFKNQTSLLNAILIYLFSGIVTLATQSKTSLLLLAVFTIIFVVLYLKQDFKKHSIHILIFVGILAVLCLCFSKMIVQIINRFIPDKTNVLSSLLTGRDEIWLMYWNECVKSPITVLFGNGLISQEVFIPSQNVTRTSHNLYLFLFYRFGLLGCIALGVGFFFLVKELAKTKTKFISSLPLLWYLIVSLVDNTFLCFNITFLPLSLLFMFEESNTNKQEIHFYDLKESSSNANNPQTDSQTIETNK